jgi:hypothetical protein
MNKYSAYTYLSVDSAHVCAYSDSWPQYIHTYIHTHTYIRTHTYTHTYIHTYMHKYINTIHTYIHTKCIYIPVLRFSPCLWVLGFTASIHTYIHTYYMYLCIVHLVHILLTCP